MFKSKLGLYFKNPTAHGHNRNIVVRADYWWLLKDISHLLYYYYCLSQTWSQSDLPVFFYFPSFDCESFQMENVLKSKSNQEVRISWEGNDNISKSVTLVKKSHFITEVSYFLSCHSLRKSSLWLAAEHVLGSDSHFTKSFSLFDQCPAPIQILMILFCFFFQLGLLLIQSGMSHHHFYLNMEYSLSRTLANVNE